MNYLILDFLRIFIHLLNRDTAFQRYNMAISILFISRFLRFLHIVLANIKRLCTKLIVIIFQERIGDYGRWWCWERGCVMCCWTFCTCCFSSSGLYCFQMFLCYLWFNFLSLITHCDDSIVTLNRGLKVVLNTLR